MQFENTVVIIPTYNEAENISILVSAIMSVCPGINLLFVDDNSQDGTRAEIEKFSAVFPNRIHVLSRPGKLGLGTAYIAGMKWSLGRSFAKIIQMDADLSHDPKYLPRMIEILDEKDLAVGSRYVSGGGTKNWSTLRKLISRFGSIYGRFILGTPIHDLTGGFNGWSREFLEKMQLDDVRSNGYVFQIEMKTRAKRLGAEFAEFPIIFVDRQIGTSKMSSGIVLEAIWRVWKLRYQLAQTR